MIKKNDVITVEITALTGGGDGIAHCDDGRVVFVANTAVGDVAEVLVIKVKKSYIIAKLARVVTPAACRTESDCSISGRCGGCVFRHISYDAECKIKHAQVEASMRRIGGFDITPEELVFGSVDNYRNKAQLPVGITADGRVFCGYYTKGSHRMVECESCRLHHAVFNDITAAFCVFATENRLSVYNEKSGTGLLRHLYIRRAEQTGEIMVCIVINGKKLPFAEKLAEKLIAVCGENLKSLVLNENTTDTNVVLGEKCRVLYGSDTITDVICGIKIAISPLSFYQVNRTMAQRLYTAAADFAQPDGKTVLDMYCGAGAIGLSMANRTEKIIGVEIVADAVENAIHNAELNGIKNAEFLCADAAAAAKQLAQRGIKPDVIVLDPPRKGCDTALLDTVANSFSPERIVYISCNDATLARDCVQLAQCGYQPVRVVPFDLFPRTGHIESLCLLTKT